MSTRVTLPLLQVIESSNQSCCDASEDESVKRGGMLLYPNVNFQAASMDGYVVEKHLPRASSHLPNR